MCPGSATSYKTRTGPDRSQPLVTGPKRATASISRRYGVHFLHLRSNYWFLLPSVPLYRSMSFLAWSSCLATLVVVSQCARIRIDVGSNGAPALIYTPRTVTAQVGDIVDFHFIDENAASSVVRGIAGAPCTPYPAKKEGFFNSGFILGEPTGVRVLSACLVHVTFILLSTLVSYRKEFETDVDALPRSFRRFRAMSFLSR